MSDVAFVEEVEEREVALPVDRRTRPLYPTYGPGDGRSWHEYFEELRGRYEPVEEPEEDEDGDEDDIPLEVTVLVPGHDLSADEIKALNARSRPAQVAKRLTAAGWHIRVRKSLVHVPAVLYKSDSKEDVAPEKAHRKGEVRYVEYDLETTCLAGVKRADNGRVGIVCTVTWDSKKGFRIAETADPWLGREIRVGYNGGRKPNEIEKEDGVQPPMGFGEWLNIVCPRPEKKKRGE